ncbi:hypothetical protein BOTCAL_0362g00040 [Botryotinia calthae]|uniref:non-specific serine/threonine protein kinase n=1 Tax=Botryotinia calthae TaxID=38488 RepID=A0A4Y8CUQ2_9HELO|nr:hypothetical protein BOTCAL_0362g00040 [Botryotinia calthae]
MEIDSAMEEAQRYLKQSQGWAPVHIGKDWVAVKRLGGGSYGIATLFEYRGSNKDVSPRKIVVKQEGGAGLNLKQESRMIQSLMKYESDHIIKIYRAYHRTMGMGTNDAMDRAIVNISKWQDNIKKRDTDIKQQLKKRYDVARIYLEFASGGDLWNWMNENCLELDPPEEYVFRIWECLLKALMVLKYGTENPHDSLFDKEPRETHHQEIAHFDIKGPNSKIGDNPRPGHERVPVHKLADFGLALEIPDANELKKSTAKRREWLKIAQGRNSYHAPEQYLVTNPNRIIGTATDMWNVGNIIYQCLASCDAVPYDEYFETRLEPDPSETILTMGKLLLDPERDMYSKRLRGLILRSLAYSPRDRLDVRDLLLKVQETLEFWNFGENHELFLENVYGGDDPWEEKFPDPIRKKKYKEMQVVKLQKRYMQRKPDYSNPKSWKPAEDEYDYDDYELLFPTRKAVQMGYREMPFELGEPVLNPIYPPKQRIMHLVGPDGKTVKNPRKRDADDPEDDPEDPEEDPQGDQPAYNKGQGKGRPKLQKTLVIEQNRKRVRPPESSEPRPWIKILSVDIPVRELAPRRRAPRGRGAPRRRARKIVQAPRRQPARIPPARVSPAREVKRQRIAEDPNSPQFYGKEYKMTSAGNLMVRRAEPSPGPGALEVERSTPWALNRPGPENPDRSGRDDYDIADDGYYDED